MRRRSGISPTEVPSRSQRVDRGALKGDGKLEKSVSREKEAHRSCQGRSRLYRSTAHDRGLAAGVSPSHLDQSTHGFLLCSLLRMCKFYLLCYHLVAHFSGCELPVCWHDAEYSNFCTMKLFLIKKLNYITSSQKEHSPIFFFFKH